MAIKYLTSKDDIWSGTAGAEIVFGRGGDDWLFGQEGRDELHGDSGNDHLDGGTEADKLYGDAGNDVLFGGNGNDTLYGGKGNDTLTGFSGNDTVYGGDGNDDINSGKGFDTVYGGNGHDVIDGGIWVDAGDGNDHVGIGLYDGKHTVVRGGPGIDDYEANMVPDGQQGSAEITDFGKDEHLIVWTGNGTFVRVDAGGVGQVSTPGTLADVSVQGHDLVITSAFEGDQLILRGAADWIHIG